MRYSEPELKREDQNRDAWYGVVHVKDRSYLHQRSMKHYYNGSEADVVVPMPMQGVGDVDAHARTVPKKTKHIITISVICLLVIFVLAYLIHMAHEDIYNVLPFMRRYLSPTD